MISSVNNELLDEVQEPIWSILDEIFWGTRHHPRSTLLDMMPLIDLNLNPIRFAVEAVVPPYDGSW